MEISKSALIYVSIGILCYFNRQSDAVLLTFITLLRSRNRIRSLVDLNLSTIITACAIIGPYLIFYKTICYIRGLTQRPTASCGFPLKPLLFPCHTTHTRLSPVKHSFSYSYLLTGIPVGLKGSVGGMISVDETNKNAWFSWKPWFSVHGDDYLARGRHSDGLRGKLNDFLQGLGIDSAQYSHAYLLTAAKFLNYSSNPVSIWLLYTADKILKAFILEVNNTFDERHSYFLAPPSKSRTGDKLPDDQAIFNSTRYSSKWPKDFYVSPFNDRSGLYSLSSGDPFAPLLTGEGQINLSITLSDPSHQKAKFVSRLFSTASPIDPARLSLWEKTCFLAKWWWVGLATIPRTLRQAYTLFMRKSMPIVSRPEPRRNTVPQHADDTEMCIESHFRAFLKHKVEQCHEEIAVRYKSAGLSGKDDSEITFYSRFPAQKTSLEVEIRVLTPIFYSRLIQYASLRDALIFESHENQTLSLSDDHIINLLQLEKIKSLSSLPISLSFRYLATIPFKLLNCLRVRPSPISHCEVSSLKSPAPGLKIPRNTGIPELDTFVSCQASYPEQLSYVKKLLRLTLSNYIAYGIIEVYDLEILVVRALMMNFLVNFFSNI